MMEYATCNESKKCFLQVTDKGRTCCKILLAVDRDGRPVDYHDGKCPFYKRDSQDKPRRFGAHKKKEDNKWSCTDTT